jgi:DNA-dependent RNA polymerase auxiliary subunit epsilon
MKADSVKIFWQKQTKMVIKNETASLYWDKDSGHYIVDLCLNLNIS